VALSSPAVGDVVLYTTDSCSFCRRAKHLLMARAIPFREVFIPRDDVEALLDLIRRTGHATMPQVLVDGRPVGGWEELERLERSGELREALAGRV
jgi:glutaredoxin 3